MQLETTNRRVRTPVQPRTRPSRRRFAFRRGVVGIGILSALIAAGLFAVRRDAPILPRDVPGSPAWARDHYGDPDAKGYKRKHIVAIEFLGRTMFVHEDAQRHFLRLESLFEARAPEYATGVALGELDDWSYLNRKIRGGDAKSNHAFGLAIDVNALSNVLGTTGDMPVEVIRQWEIEGGDWGGDWSRPDPMHFETHLTPQQIRSRYNPDGTPKAWYLEELVGG